MTERHETSSIAWIRQWAAAWDRFWFTPKSPTTLAVIRIACGAMLAYVHLIWAFLASDFLGSNAWISTDTVRELHREDWAWSWLWYIESPSLILLHQLVAIAASLGMMLGFLTRLATPLAWWMTLMICHRLTGALFGLDQVLMMLSMYLMISDCGSVLSIDAVLKRRSTVVRSQQSPWLAILFPEPSPSVANNLATRLIQLHLCVIYLFGGLGKMRGEMWYDGSAMWYTIVNYEYQSFDITWLGHWPLAISTLSALTIFWETFYCALVWPKLTRPVTLALAVFVHGGIAFALGMVTFGTIMIVANMAFIEPETLQRWLRLRPPAGQPTRADRELT